MCDVLKISPYQLFLEQPEITKFNNKTEQQQLILSLKQEIDFLLQLYIEK